MKDCAAALSSVTVSYPSAHGTVTALDNVTIGLERGSSTAIVGRSGSGKTTLISVLSLMRQPTSGQVFLNGSETSGLSNSQMADLRSAGAVAGGGAAAGSLSNSQMADLRSARIGVVFQSYHLDPSLTATENVMLPWFFLSRPGPRRRARKRAGEILDRLEVGELAQRKPNQMSGGQ